jgi:hypothetical protein
MGKITSAKFPEVGKLMATQAGKQLQELVEYLSGFCDDMALNLKNSLTFGDNFLCNFTSVTLADGVASGVQVKNRAKMILVAQVVSTLYGIDKFSWYIDEQGATKVLVNFSGSPPAGTQIQVVLLIVYG